MEFYVPPLGFDITRGGPDVLPLALQQVVCTRVSVEFLKMSSEGLTAEEIANQKNHAIIKVSFAAGVRNGNVQYRGARLSMEPDYEVGSTGPHGNQPSYKPGVLLLRPVQYSEETTSSLCTLWVESAPMMLGNLVRFITNAHMHLFYFVNINNKYFGCRDFVTQLFYQLHTYNYVRSEIVARSPAIPWFPFNNIYESLGLRFKRQPPRSFAACPIDKGHFPYYVPVIKPYMPYAGSARAVQIQQILS